MIDDLRLATCSEEWLQQERMNAAIAFRNLYKPQVIAVMGYLNRMIWAIAGQSAKAIFKAEDGTFQVNRARLHEVINGSVMGVLQTKISTLYLQRFFKQHWDGASRSAHGIRSARNILRDHGLFEFEDVKPGSTYVPPTLERIDFVRSLIAYEACEKILLTKEVKTFPKMGEPIIEDGEDFDWRYQTIDDLPMHKGAAVQVLFNIVFEGIDQYNREPECFGNADVLESDGEPEYIPCHGVFRSIIEFAANFWKDKYKFYLRKQYAEKQRRQKKSRSPRSLIPAWLEPAIPY